MATSLDRVPGDFCVRALDRVRGGRQRRVYKSVRLQHNPPARARPKQEIEDMRYIDAFNHFFPKRIYELMLQSPAGQKDLGKRMRGIPALYDVEERLRGVDSFPDYTQVICLGMPAIDRLTGARLGNDGLSGVGAKKPDRFVGYPPPVPMNGPQA